MSDILRNARDPDRNIDWEVVKSRLTRAADALPASEQQSTEQARQILAARARRLAEVPARTADTGETVELLKFQRGTDAFAIETQYVREVLRPEELTRVPAVAPFLIGVTNLRGEVLAIMDLSVFYHGTVQSDQVQPRVIVVGQQRPEFGIVADDVDEVVTRRTQDILPVPPSVPAEGRRFLTGVMVDAMLVLNGASLLEDSQLYVDQND